MIPLLLLSPASPVALRRVARPDDRATYTMRGLIELGGKNDVRFTGLVKERVRSIEGDTLTTAVESTVTVDLMNVVRQGRSIESDRVERLDGTLVTAAKTDSTLLFGAPRVDRLRDFYPPPAPVEVGAGWWRTEGRRDDLSAPPASTFVKLEGEEKIGTRDAWRVSTDANEADDASPVHVKGMLWLDKADGSLVRGQWAIDGYTYSASSPPLHAKYELTRAD